MYCKEMSVQMALLIYKDVHITYQKIMIKERTIQILSICMHQLGDTQYILWLMDPDKGFLEV